MRVLLRSCRPYFVRLAPCLASLAPSYALASPPDDPHPAWTRSGDVLQWGIPAFAFGLTYLLDPESGTSKSGAAEVPPGLNWPGPRLDKSERYDFLISFARMEVVTYALKYGVNEERPYHGGGQSFPSGHAASSFMGAEFIRKNYGWGWGGPALLAATWVGYTRVESYNHYWYDVVAGAVVGILSNHDLDEIHFKGSSLRFAPALMARSGSTASDSASFEPQSIGVADDHRLVPGVQIEWRFGAPR